MPRFLVLQAARFGDLVQTKRLILSLEQEGEVHLAVDAGLVPLARLLFPGAIVHGLRLHGQPDVCALAENKDVLTLWRELEFQTVYNCNFSELTAALCRIFEPGRVMGNRPAAGGILRSPWARMIFRLSEQRVLAPLNLIDFWGHLAPCPIPAAAVNPPAQAGGQGLGVVLAGRESRRSLPLPLLAQVVHAIFQIKGGPRVHLLGTRAEQPAARRLIRLLPARMQGRVEDLSGKTDWQGLAEAVQGLDALICPDTGIMHLAAHLGTPILAFFLSSAWCHETGPYGEGHLVWQAATQCSPCLESAPCPRGTACLAAFASDSLLRSLAFALQGQTHTEGDVPPGLQIWRSGLDALGGRFSLLAGQDAHAAERLAARAVLQEFLHFSHLEGVQTDQRQRLVPDSEWMLPPWRYA